MTRSRDYLGKRPEQRPNKTAQIKFLLTGYFQVLPSIIFQNKILQMCLLLNSNQNIHLKTMYRQESLVFKSSLKKETSQDVTRVLTKYASTLTLLQRSGNHLNATPIWQSLSSLSLDLNTLLSWTWIRPCKSHIRAESLERTLNKSISSYTPIKLKEKQRT